MNTKFLQNDFYNESQSWVLKQVTLHEGIHPVFADATHVLLKVKIRRNAYDNQSQGEVRYWNGDVWACVIRRPIQVLECERVSYVDKDPSAILFAEDANNLRASALQVVASKASLKANGNK